MIGYNPDPADSHVEQIDRVQLFLAPETERRPIGIFTPGSA